MGRHDGISFSQPAKRRGCLASVKLILVTSGINCSCLLAVAMETNARKDKIYSVYVFIARTNAFFCCYLSCHFDSPYI
jgi:hypothetical protein